METITTTQTTEAKVALESAMKFILAGKAVFTLRSNRTGTRFTYKVRKPSEDKPGPPVWFVSLLTGPNNEGDYQYLGIIRDGQFQLTGKSKAKKDAPSVVAFSWFLRFAAKGEDPHVELWHAGRCGRCGRTLTVPESVDAGFGPECIQLVGGQS